MQFLTGQLAAAVGLGGRDRRAGSAAERARVNITRAIRAALARIRAHSPALAGHLDATIHTVTAGSALTTGAPNRSGSSPAPMISPGRT